MPAVFAVGPGYAISGRAAVKALAAHSPEAADWWRKNAAHVVAPQYRLWFPVAVCERLGGLATGDEKKADDWVGLGSDGKGGVWKRDVPPWQG
jgi:hypothetical protein